MSDAGDGIGKAEDSQSATKTKNYNIKARALTALTVLKRGVSNTLSPLGHIDSIGFFTAVLCLVAWLQWRTFEKTDVTLRAVQRPWISIEVTPASDLVIGKKDATVRFRYTLTNVGNSPAMNVVVWPRLVANKFDTFPPDEVRKHCDGMAASLHRDQRDLFLFGHVIFPREGKAIEEGASVDVVLPVPKPTPPPNSLTVNPWVVPPNLFTGEGVTVRRSLYVVSCVDYQSSLESDHHQTAEIRYLMRINSAGENDIALLSEETIPKDELELRSTGLWEGEYAN